ncbi:MAG: S41 family peptidase [Luteibaculaceae bacterium]
MIKKLVFVVGVVFATVEIFASEPQWLRYSAISPNGEHIAFSYQGDLFLVSAQGGEARPLTNHVAHDFMPVWSPDGEKIAFASDRHGNFDVFVVEHKGGAATRLTTHSANDFPMAFSPDGKTVYYSSARLGAAESVLFPTPVLAQLYEVNVAGGREKLTLSWPVHSLSISKSGKIWAYHDRKGYEDEWRKHHTSSVARDIWFYNPTEKTNTKFDFFEGEDRNPVLLSDTEFAFLSQKNGAFNVFTAQVGKPETAKQLTQFEHHPVRFLTAANNGTLCFGYNGFIYTLEPGKQPQKVKITISAEPKESAEQLLSVKSASEISVSPSGDEIAFVFRGNVFVTATEFGTTKQITNTPEMERSVSFSPCGKKLLYASERNGSWNIYQTTLPRESEAFFYASTLLKEEALIADENETFQPVWSPCGTKIAYLSNRTEVKVFDVKTKKSSTVMNGLMSYSYSDGDQYFSWSPDSKWLAIQYYPNNRWVTEIGIFDATQTDVHHNITLSGYSEGNPIWAMNGEALLYFTDKYGYRSHGSWGAERDVVGLFLTRAAKEKFRMSEEERALAKKEKEAEEKAAEEDKKSKKEKKKTAEPNVKFELDLLADLTQRLTIHSSQVVDAYLTKDADKLFYLTRFEKGYDLWVQDFVKNETKILAKLNGSPSKMHIDEKEEYAFLLNRGTPTRVSLKNGEQKSIAINAEMQLDYLAEKAFVFDHAWRQTREKFYLEDLHGVDWDFYKKEYEKHLPWITNNYDFAEMLSEMLGELNASHTGARFRPNPENADATASLAIYEDFSFEGNGVKIKDILPRNFVFESSSKVKPGHIILKIDGESISPETNWYALLNRKEGKRVLLELFCPKTKSTWQEVVKPIGLGEEQNLAYMRWVRTMEKMVSEISGGKIGYVHVRGMNSPAFREVYKNLLGKFNETDAVVVDTRFNGGGWLHDDLATLLSGEKYLTFSPRGQENIGGEPMFKWSKPSVVLMSEGNYSDAHMFPFVYKELGIGKLVGMPVPGTGTAVWWETQIDPTLVFGIPQVGMKDNRGNLLENLELKPDIEVALPNIEAVKGKDAQIEAAVKALGF